MSVSFARQVVAGLRARGVTVHEWAGWESRGNGQTSDYEGLIIHHTATGYGSALPGTGVGNLLVSGRSDLRGPLCNTSGNEDGSVTIIAAHPANHAGASGGRSMGPLPVTSSFNKRVWGHEIVYPGNDPMRPAQYQTAVILGQVVTGILKRNEHYARAHAETSITGKWDPGHAPGKTIDMAKYRRDVANFSGGGVDELADPRVVGLIEDLHQTVISGSFEKFHNGAHAKLNNDLGYIISRLAGVIEANTKALRAEIAALSARVNTLSQIDVDEVQLAAELKKAGVVGITPEQIQAAIVAANKTQWSK